MDDSKWRLQNYQYRYFFSKFPRKFKKKKEKIDRIFLSSSISRCLITDKKGRRTRKMLRSIVEQKKKKKKENEETRSWANNFYRWRAGSWIIADRSNFEHNVRVVYLRYARPSVAIRGRTMRASRINMHRATVDDGDNLFIHWKSNRRNPRIDGSFFSRLDKFQSCICFRFGNFLKERSIKDIYRRNNFN